MKYFKNIQAGTIEEVKNEKVIAQMEKHPEVYEPCDKDGKPLKEAKAPKEAKKEEPKEAEAPKAEK